MVRHIRQKQKWLVKMMRKSDKRLLKDIITNVLTEGGLIVDVDIQWDAKAQKPYEKIIVHRIWADGHERVDDIHLSLETIYSQTFWDIADKIKTHLKSLVEAQ